MVPTSPGSSVQCRCSDLHALYLLSTGPTGKSLPQQVYWSLVETSASHHTAVPTPCLEKKSTVFCA